MFKKIVNLSVFSLFTFFLSEVSLYMVVHLGWLNIIMPTYSMDSPEDFLPERSYLYGHRHLPNSTYEVKKNCLHTHYQFNSLGFREQEVNQNSKEARVIVLGDSFMEGVGVEEDQRVGDLLEQETNIQHINFAMADKGSTQSFVIYDSIASAYLHDAVLISIFPTNDFIDDDPNIGKSVNQIRPCWKGKFPDYHLSFVPDSSPAQKDYSLWKHFLKTHTYTYDALFYLKESIRASFSTAAYPKSGYFDFTDEQINRLFFSIKKIKEKAAGKKLILISIPSHLDYLSKKPVEQSIEPKLRDFCNQNDVELIGLYSIFKYSSEKPWETYFYSCDSHWNAKGHQLVAETILSKSNYYQNIARNE